MEKTPNSLVEDEYGRHDIEKQVRSVKKLLKVLEKNKIITEPLNNYTMVAVPEFKKQTLSEQFPIPKGLKYGCGLSPALFKTYLSHTLKN